MQIPAGPSQVADVYRGNPGALQANIQKEQQQKPNITPDFAKLIALGTVTSDKDNAAKAQALQQLQQLQAQSTTGKPPTIFEQLQRKAAQQRMVTQQQAQPQAQGLPGLAQEEAAPSQGIDRLPSDFQFAGGGIVAFKKGGKPTSGSAGEDAQLSSFPESIDDILAGDSAEAAPAPSDMAGMSPAYQELMGYARNTLGQSEQAVNEEAMQRHDKAMGLDALLKEKQDRVNQREQLLKQQQEGRMPDWVNWMAGVAKANPRMGLGYALASGTEASEKSAAANEENDRKFNLEVMKLRDEITQAKIEGNYKKAAVGEAALNHLRQAKASAAQTGASLENAYQTNQARVQTAKDSLAGRMQMAKDAAAQRSQTAANALAETTRYHQTQERLASERAEELKRQHNEKMAAAEQKRLDDLAKFADSEERKFQGDLNKNPEYKTLALQKMAAQRQLMSKDPEKRAKAEQELGRINEEIIKLTMEKRGGAAPAVATAPPPGAVRLKQP